MVMESVFPMEFLQSLKITIQKVKDFQKIRKIYLKVDLPSNIDIFLADYNENSIQIVILFFNKD